MTANAPIKKIAVLGAESTGKTWLCEKLAAYFNTVWVPEYAREYFNNSDIYNYNLNDLVVIARRQLEMEEEAAQHAQKLLFCDTTLITLKIWAELEFQSCPEFIAGNISAGSYHHYLITDNDIPWQKDALRQNKHSRELLLELNIKEVQKTGRPYSIISGGEEMRLLNSLKVLDGLL